MNHWNVTKLRQIASYLRAVYEDAPAPCPARQAAHDIEVIAAHEEQILQKQKLLQVRARERRKQTKLLESKRK